MFLQAISGFWTNREKTSGKGVTCSRWYTYADDCSSKLLPCLEVHLYSSSVFGGSQSRGSKTAMDVHWLICILPSLSTGRALPVSCEWHFCPREELLVHVVPGKATTFSLTTFCEGELIFQVCICVPDKRRAYRWKTCRWALILCHLYIPCLSFRPPVGNDYRSLPNDSLWVNRKGSCKIKALCGLSN